MRAALFYGLTVKEIIKIMEKQIDLVDYVQGLDFKVDFIHPPFKMCFKNENLVDEMHKREIGVNVWTPNTEEDINALLKFDLDGIITNNPEILLKNRWVIEALYMVCNIKLLCEREGEIA